MTHSKPNLDDHLLEEFVKDLETTTTQVQALLKDIRDSEIEFATIKTELRIFIENVKELASIIREGDDGNSLLTRIALVEKSVTEIEAWIKAGNAKTASSAAAAHTVQVADKTGRWQLMTAIATGVLALLTSSITLLINVFGKH